MLRRATIAALVAGMLVPWVAGAQSVVQDGQSFRGVLLVSGGDGDPSQGFEDVPANCAVLITRDLQVQLADLNP